MKKLIVMLLVFVCTITSVFAAEVDIIKDNNFTTLFLRDIKMLIICF